MMLWLRVSVILKNKSALHIQKGANLGLKCVRLRSAAGLRPDPLWGSLSAPPDPLAAIGGGVPTSKGEGREGNSEGRGWEGGGNGRGGREGEKREGRGRTTCIPHFF